MATPSVPKNDIGIQPMFTTQNPTYTNPIYRNKVKLMLHSTATPGAPAQNFFNGWNKSSAKASVEFVLDNEKILEYMPVYENGKNCYKTWHCGSSGNNTYIATECCEPIEAQLIPVNFYEQGRNATYKRTYSIQRIQMELQERGFYTGEIDGSFGPATEAATKAFQSSVGLSVDGIVGKKTLAKLADRTGSYAAYDVASATPFFNAVYNNAVALFGWLCKFVGGKPSEIICHAEGNAQGIASNHADVNHWFPLHGKTMDDFRSDVQKYVDGKWVPLGTTTPSTDTDTDATSELDQAYLKAIEDLTDVNILNTPTYWEGILETGTVSTEYTHTLIQKAGSYFVAKSHVNAVNVLEEACGLNSPLYWKGEAYSEVNTRFLIIVVARAVNMANGVADDADMTYDDAVNVCTTAGLITMPDYWKSFQDDDIYEDPYAGNVKAFMKAAAKFFVDYDFKFGVTAIEDPIGMNSKDYWLNSESYSVTNVEYLVSGIAGAL